MMLSVVRLLSGWLKYLETQFVLYMNYDKELMSPLGNELVGLWSECSVRCDKIESLVKQLKEESEK